MYSRILLCFTTFQWRLCYSYVWKVIVFIFFLFPLIYLMWKLSSRTLCDIIIMTNLYIFCISFHKVQCTFFFFLSISFLPSSLLPTPPHSFLLSFSLPPPSIFLFLPPFLPLLSYISIDLSPYLSTTYMLHM